MLQILSFPLVMSQAIHIIIRGLVFISESPWITGQVLTTIINYKKINNFFLKDNFLCKNKKKINENKAQANKRGKFMLLF